MRDKIAQDFANQAGQFDVATLGATTRSVLLQERVAAPLDEYVEHDADFDQADILEPIRRPPARTASSTRSRSTASPRS